MRGWIRCLDGFVARWIRCLSGFDAWLDSMLGGFDARWIGRGWIQSGWIPSPSRKKYFKSYRAKQDLLGSFSTLTVLCTSATGQKSNP